MSKADSQYVLAMERLIRNALGPGRFVKEPNLQLSSQDVVPIYLDWEAELLNPPIEQYDAQREIVERYGPVIDRAVELGSTEELEAAIRLDLPLTDEEGVLSVVPIMYKAFRQLNMTARSDLVKILWLKLLDHASEQNFNRWVSSWGEGVVDRFAGIRNECPGVRLSD